MAAARPLRFAYYDSLSAESKRTYRRSDALLRIAVPRIEDLVPLAQAIQPVLEAADRAAVERACQALVDGLNARLAAPPVHVKVLERRPLNKAYELQGLYERSSTRWCITSTTSTSSSRRRSTRRASTRASPRSCASCWASRCAGLPQRLNTETRRRGEKAEKLLVDS